MVIYTSKTEDVINLLNAGETDTNAIKEKTGASEALISRCRQRIKNAEPAAEPKQEEEPEPTDDEIDGIIKKVKITPDEKFLTKDKETREEDYRCMGCGHEWKAKSLPVSCPKCGCEF